jgi:hypothetical protein
MSALFDLQQFGRFARLAVRLRALARPARSGESSPEGRAFYDMHNRCRNPNTIGWENWGGRGITVCDRWNDFDVFLADMGRRPSPQHSLDRIDNELGYSPQNCRWATRIEQNNNSRSNRRLTIDGREATIAEHAREANIHPDVLRRRIKRGWHPDWLLVPFPGMAFWEGKR